jgi:hypothetical protein
VEVIVHDEPLSNIKEVDAKLVRLAKILDCRVITNDFNLNKVAKLEGVTVLNINDLANAMRLVIFPGEEMSVMIKKEGKERNQGVAFMDDGTMIVVDDARRLIGRTIKVTVTSVLQTSAGRMIFASLIERYEEERYERPESHDRRPEERHERPQERRPEERHERPQERRPEERHERPQERQPEAGHEKPQERQPEAGHEKPQERQPEANHEKHENERRQERPPERQAPQDQPHEEEGHNNG